ncbi:ATP-binding protein [Orientia tsutsugamushi]|uniref:hypothetical protein n=1 Tax=Orientia tsutsugamushi TaxID=784 RepID=UPI00061F1CBF|nr:hypothetical protein [Orientia tsutsugamushi]KJV73395.1 hypothetical protein OTSTA763_1578 [Orientia tsutsugamushi str. TA763]SPP24835.1 ATP-binding protein [Orientia tsutsugamushi]
MTEKINIIASLNGVIFLFRQYIVSTNVMIEIFNTELLINNRLLSKLENDVE